MRSQNQLTKSKEGMPKDNEESYERSPSLDEYQRWLLPKEHSIMKKTS